MLNIVSTDIVDDPASITIDAILEVPGMRSDEIHVTLREGHVIIHGVRRPSYRDTICSPVEDPSFHSVDIDPQSSENTPATSVRELRYGPFQRRIKLPDGTKVLSFICR